MSQAEENYITGTVMTFFYENPSNYYKVMLIKIDETNTSFESDEIVVTGVFGQIHQDVSYCFKGRLVSHPKYGQQFSVTSYSQTQPTGELGLVRYLSSEKFPGVGEKTAKRMVRELGLDVIDKIIADKDCLKGITGLTPKKRQQIHETLIASQGTEKTLIALSNLGFSANLAQKIMNKYKEKTMEILEENPYLLVRDIEGVGFKRIDAIAKELNVAPDNINRLAGAVFVVVRDVCYQNGDTYLLDKEVIVLSQKLLESSQAYLVEYDQISEGLNELLREGVLVCDDDKIALSSLYFSEIGISSSINRLQKNAKNLKIDITQINEAIAKVEEQDGIKYDEVQYKAIQEIIQSPMYILTGGPGTGKTTIIKGVVEVYKMIHKKKKVIEFIKRDEEPVKLAAPTGRAAKRMSEVTHLPASTIHRLLGLTADDNGFMTAEEITEISDILLIVDEMSMIDTWLMNRLLKSISSTTQILFVGDRHQLPSVGPGQVLDDLLASKKIPSIELTQIHRQKDNSTIIQLAHEMKRGQLPSDFKEGKSDRSFISCHPNQIVTVIEQVVEKAMIKGFDKRDIQVLAPMYRGEAGIDAINTIMQNIMNPIIGQKREVDYFERKFRVGDKVLQLVNRAEFSVYNGDIGEIVAIEYAKENEEKVDKIFVAFDQIEMEYPKSDWNQLTLAYCCSIHKAQGSEFRLVILPMVHQYSRMLRRNLLYTAVTRSKELLIMCGQDSAFNEAVSNESDRRKTQLITFLMEEQIAEKKEEHEQSALSVNSEEKDAKDNGELIEEQVSGLNDTREIKQTTLNCVDDTTYEVRLRDTDDNNKIHQDVMVLNEKIRSTEKNDDGILTMEKIFNHLIDPMIGMNNQTPYDFIE